MTGRQRPHGRRDGGHWLVTVDEPAWLNYLIPIGGLRPWSKLVAFRRTGAIDRGFRVNEQIRITPLRVVDADGRMLGVLSRQEALARARRAGLDLVEVAPMDRPPVCRIMDYGKFKYQQKKRAAKQRQHQVQVKEIRLRPKTSEHDLMVKINHARELLERKNKVLLSVFFRGRELAHVEQGRAVLEMALEKLEEVSKLERPPRMEGRRMTAIVAPRQ